MQIESWLADREKDSTIAGMARRMARSRRRYSDLEERLRTLYVLEALIRNGGDQKRTAKAVGMSRAKINRIIRPLGLKGIEIRELATSLGEGK